MIEEKFHVGYVRLIPKNTKIFSIANQSIMSFEEDTIVRITSMTYGKDIVFVKLMQVIGEATPSPHLIEKGTDELTLLYSKTLDYKLPEPAYRF